MASVAEALEAEWGDEHDFAPAKDSRGWAMRRGHCKRLRGGRGREGTRGRAAFARSTRGRATRLWNPYAVSEDWMRRHDARDLREQVRGASLLGTWVVEEEESDARLDRELESLADELDTHVSFLDVSSSKLPDESVFAESDGEESSTTASSGSRSADAATTERDESDEEALAGMCSGRGSSAGSSSGSSACIGPSEAHARPSRPRREPTPWELAVARAKQAAEEWFAEAPAPVEPQPAGRRSRSRLARAARARGPASAQEALGRLGEALLEQHGLMLRQHLALLGTPLRFESAKVACPVAERFMAAKAKYPDAEVVPVIHGTNVQNYSSIFSSGLVIPGRGNNLRVVNGSAHGLGIYTAPPANARLSRSYSNDNRLLVCGLLERAQWTDAEVKNVPGAVVIFDDSLVVPLFQAIGNVLLPESALRARPTSLRYGQVLPAVGATEPHSRLLVPPQPANQGRRRRRELRSQARKEQRAALACRAAAVAGCAEGSRLQVAVLRLGRRAARSRRA